MHPFDWQLLKSEYLIQDQWLSLRADTCQLPNGRTIAPYYVLEYPCALRLPSWVNRACFSTVPCKSKCMMC
jgi:hypothetical protein